MQDIEENLQMTKGIMYTKDFLGLGGTNFIEVFFKILTISFFKI